MNINTSLNYNIKLNSNNHYLKASQAEAQHRNCHVHMPIHLVNKKALTQCSRAQQVSAKHKTSCAKKCG